MTKSFFTHFIMIFAVHAVLISGTLKVVQSQSEEKKVIPRLGNGSMVVKVSSSSTLVKPVKKTLSKMVPKSQPKLETQVTESSPSASGGNPQGFSFGTGNKSTKFSALDLYKAELRAKIDKNKYYPTLSKRLGQSGTVVIAFTLLEDGNIVNVRIDKPSQYERLNLSALDAVKKVVRFKPLPKEMDEDRMDITVPVNFKTI